jgi:ligand-binding SRPBCC domain-containing protein
MIKANREMVAAFHFSPQAMPRLTPPPIIVQIRYTEPLKEGSRTDFTLWFGPFPVRWSAVHSGVDPQSGFCDTQLAGPMASWSHQHHWQAKGEDQTLMEEIIEFEHHPGLRGLWTRLFFAVPLLQLMLANRRRVIRAAAITGAGGS